MRSQNYFWFIFLSSLITTASYASEAMDMTPQQMSHMHTGKHGAMAMHGMYGLYPMNREASGSSWQPDSSYMGGLHFMKQDWMLMLHGNANFVYDRQGGPRGGEKTFSTNMLMGMAQKDVGPGTWGLRAMLSLEPLMGKSGYPLLFQTGETANGITPLTDRQHPHDAFMELATSYSIPLSQHSSIFAYVGWPGEPALGPPAFMHRLSGIDLPEAPLTHHFLDSTHISFGVVTLGYIWKNIKLEGSAFNGREPDQFRWRIRDPKFNSQSVRLSYNPTPNWALQVSYGRLKSPEGLEPDVNVGRTTASAIYNLPFGADHYWQTTLAIGKNAKQPGPTLYGYLLESAVKFHRTHTVLGRFERVGRDELFANTAPLGNQTFRISKLSLGYIYELPKWQFLKPGIGALISTYNVPSALHATYGRNPISYMLFARVTL
jgi:hypothetical protein